MDHIQKQIAMIWKTEQEILDVIDYVCRQNNLRYSLAYGTLIGAVRHGGFIPWDDDIDIMMPREDYEKLLTVWGESAPDGYILQNYHTDHDFTQNFTKIRKDNTTFLQKETEKEKKYHKGVFVDIFPGDRVAPGRFLRKIQYIACAMNLLYSRGFTSGSGGMMEIIEKILLCLPVGTKCKLRDYTENIIKKWNDRTDTDYIFASTIKECRVYYPFNTFENLKEIMFEQKLYSCVEDYDKILRIQYGDYMQLPPESERVWKHHPLIIDFEHNYEELN